MKKVLLILCSIFVMCQSPQVQSLAPKAKAELDSMNLSRYQPVAAMQKLSDSFLVDSEYDTYYGIRSLIYVTIISSSEIIFEKYTIGPVCRYDSQVVGYFVHKKGWYFIIRTANPAYLKGLLAKTDDVRAFPYKPTKYISAPYDQEDGCCRFDYLKTPSGRFELVDDYGYIE